MIVFPELYQANALYLPIADNSVDCVVTSPPYWGLRDYGTATWVDGDEECDHMGNVHSTQTGFNKRWFGKEFATDKQGGLKEFYKNVCGKCGAVRKDDQLGLEETPEEYCNNMTNVFREVWRVLKPTGTVWLNLGDSYVGTGHKAKDLVGIPWRVAFALQADGWYLRSDIIWSKPNPMPESVKDRPTKAHEYIFLLTKSKNYYYDADAIGEPAKDWGIRDRTNGKYHNEGTGLQPHTGLEKSYATKNKRSVWSITTKPYADAHFATFPEDLIEPCILAGSPEGGIVLDPFVGSGTAMVVAQKHRRKGIGIDLNKEYLDLAVKRIKNSKYNNQFVLF
jgi:DNA modification methylase